MLYWSNVFATAGATCIAVAFIDGNKFAMLWGIVMAFYGYKLQNGRK